MDSEEMVRISYSEFLPDNEHNIAINRSYACIQAKQNPRKREEVRAGDILEILKLYLENKGVVFRRLRKVSCGSMRKATHISRNFTRA